MNRRLRTLLVLLGALFLTVSTTSPGQTSTAEVKELAALRVTSGDQVAVDVAAPVASTRSRIFRRALRVVADGQPVTHEIRPLPLARQDIVLVVSPATEVATFQGAIAEFALQLPPGTRMALVSAGSQPTVLQPLTTDVSLFLPAIRELRERSSPNLGAAIDLVSAMEDLRTPNTVVLLASEPVDLPAEALESVSGSSAVYDVRVGPVGALTPANPRIQHIMLSDPTMLLGALDDIFEALQRQFRVQVQGSAPVELQLAVETPTGLVETLVRVGDVPSATVAPPSTQPTEAVSDQDPASLSDTERVTGNAAAQQALRSEPERGLEIASLTAALTALILVVPLLLLAPVSAQQTAPGRITAPLLRRLLPAVETEQRLPSAVAVVVPELGRRHSLRLRLLPVVLRRASPMRDLAPLLLVPRHLRHRHLLGAALEWGQHQDPATARGLHIALRSIEQRETSRRVIDRYGGRVRMLSVLLLLLLPVIALLGRLLESSELSMRAFVTAAMGLSVWNAAGCWWLWRTGRFPFTADPRHWGTELDSAADSLELRSVRAAAEPGRPSGSEVAEELLAAAAEQRRVAVRRVQSRSTELHKQALIPLLCCVLPATILALIVLL